MKLTTVAEKQWDGLIEKDEETERQSHGRELRRAVKEKKMRFVLDKLWMLCKQRHELYSTD